MKAPRPRKSVRPFVTQLTMKHPTLLIAFLGALCSQVIAAAPDFAQAGWSTLNGGTTGGSAATVVNVSTVAELKAAAESATSQTIRITAPLTSGKGTKINIKSNKTILGDGDNGFLQGIGFSITAGASNIIIRNLKMTLRNMADPGEANNGDCIQIYGDGGAVRNVWIDHCEFFCEPPASQPDADKYDGAIDLTNDVAFVTISWCVFRDFWKTNLVGNSPTDNFNRRATFHHNHYNGVIDRCPSYRFGQGHVYNSYFQDVGPAFTGTPDIGGDVAEGVCVHIRAGATVKVEGSVFENSNDPIVVQSDSFVIVGTSNLASQFTGCSGKQPINSTTGASLTIPYAYTAAATSTVKNTFLTWAGSGKINP